MNLAQKTSYILFASLVISTSGWQTNFKVAQQEAISNNKNILLNFSGSDWCGPCIRLKKEIFETSEFREFADANLVLVNADFPRLNKNKQDKITVKENEALADKYNSSGKFPLTLLLNPNGDVLKEWDGFPQVSANDFVAQLKSVSDAGK